mgnify:FL=1
MTLCILMNNEDLQKLCIEWQERLNLRDWRVKAVFCSDYELDDAYAQIQPDPYQKIAYCKVVSAEDYENEVIPYDPEQILVHELCHLHAPNLMPEHGTQEFLELETLIEQVSQSLVNIHRSKQNYSKEDKIERHVKELEAKEGQLHRSVHKDSQCDKGCETCRCK